jgi:hypothetical protein
MHFLQKILPQHGTEYGLDIIPNIKIYNTETNYTF